MVDARVRARVRMAHPRVLGCLCALLGSSLAFRASFVWPVGARSLRVAIHARNENPILTHGSLHLPEAHREFFNETFAQHLKCEKDLHQLTMPPNVIDFSDFCVPCEEAKVGTVLSATENVKHPQYDRAIALLFERSEVAYTRAIILNKPTKVTVGKLLKDMPVIAKAFGDNFIFQGGFQEEERFSVLHTHSSLPNSVEVSPGVYLGDLTTLGVMAAANITSGPVKIFIGRVVWMQDYFDVSLRNGDWSLCELHNSLLFDKELPGGFMAVPPQFLWEYVQSLLGGTSRYRWLMDITLRPERAKLLKFVADNLDTVKTRMKEAKQKAKFPPNIQTMEKWYGTRPEAVPEDVADDLS